MMVFGKDFYVFEVLENYEDKLLCFENGKFYKNTRFIGWEDKKFKKVFKSNMEELVCIPIDKVKKIYKIGFEEMEDN